MPLPSAMADGKIADSCSASAPLFRWRRNAAGAIIITAIYTNNFTAIITNSSPLYAAV